ncbi:MAG TPA: ATP-binding protein [Phenylobacterium sp.]
MTAQPTEGRDLAEDLRRIRELFDQAPGSMIVFTGPDHVVRMANAAYLTFVGVSGILGLPVREALPRGSARGFADLLDYVYRTGRSRVLRAAELRVTRQPGGPDEVAYADFILQPLKTSRGVVYGIFCQGHEVTNEKLAADRLSESREQLRAALEATQAIFDNSHDLICVIGPDATFRQVNRPAERILGYTPEEMIGRSYLDFIHPDDVALSEEITARIHAGVLTNTFTTRYRCKDGRMAPIMWSAVWSDPHDSLFAIGRDMSDHFAAEERLRQAQKMEAVGRLTGGVAHDFNNLLTVVIGATEALSEALADQPELAPVARMALEAAERGAELVSQLLAVARSQPLAPQTVDCNRFLEGLLPMLQRTLGRDIEVDLRVGPDEACCLADLTQLTSAMLNLCINARDAMPAGGRLTLRVDREAGRKDAPDLVVLRVEDTGEGMSAQTRAQALEPFFTTKPPGKGSGLGLSMVYGFAVQSGGRLEIQSEPGHGTRVSLALPQAASCAQAVQTPVSAEAPVVAAGRRVVLVEDDDMVRGQVARHLEALGCEVSALDNGHDALDVLASGERVDLLMTDINMPGGLNGRQLADHARLLDPTLRILFTSGHTDDPILRTVQHDPHAGFIAKPYRRADLARKLAELAPA